MIKEKLKLSLIDDYIKILSIENFNLGVRKEILEEFDTNVYLQTKTLDLSLKTAYEFVFKKIKAVDMSYVILKREIESLPKVYDVGLDKETLKKNIHENFKYLKDINENLIKKIKKLSLAENDLKFLNQKLAN
ncbi:MAG: hypothetical protein E7374_00815 [Clostridiales bacterium]|nr:hypothetical protein [Clostridiales bacterium]